VFRWVRRIGLTLLVLFGLVTALSFTYNIYTAGREVSATSLYPGPFIKLNGAQVAYRTWGTAGTPIVLVHGFAESTYAWSAVGPLLGRDHRVYALDLFGFGYTERVGPYTLDAWTKEVVSFMQALHLTKPIIVGHSLGAAVAANIALVHPDMIAGIVLADGDALSAGGPPSWVRHLFINPYLTSAFRLVRGSGRIVKRVLEAAYGPNHPQLTPALIAQWTNPFRVKGSEAAVEAMVHEQNGIPGLSNSQLAQVKTSAFVIWGSKDDVDPVASGQATAKLLHAQFRELSGSGHLSMLVDPVGFARAVEQFAATLTHARR
jgi:pimeloyl-ACP methyl ester carboxylesterase